MWHWVAAALATGQEVAKSRIPTLGDGETYAGGNVRFALRGSVIVAPRKGGRGAPVAGSSTRKSVTPIRRRMRRTGPGIILRDGSWTT